MFKHRLSLFVVLAGLSVNAWAVMSDPTRPVGYNGPGPAGLIEPAQARDPIVSSVLISPERNIAIINGLPRKLGETFDGMQVVEIREEGVHLMTSSGLKILKVHPQDIKGKEHGSN